MGARRSVLHEEKIPNKSGGISPDEREHIEPDGESQSREGGSAAFDFALTYSGLRTTGKRGAALQKRLTSIVHRAGDEEPFIRDARTALLAMRKTQVRGLPPD